MRALRTRATGRCMRAGAGRWTASATSMVTTAGRSSSTRPSRCRSTPQPTGTKPNAGWPCASDANRRADVRPLRQFVPRTIRRGVSAQLARVQAVGIERDLEAIARGTHTIVAGPWLGEVGFELLYWVPFLRWFTGRFQVDPQRMLVVSRGGTSSWYRPFASGYREIFD